MSVKKNKDLTVKENKELSVKEKNKPDAEPEAPDYEVLKWDAPETNSVKEEIKFQNAKASRLPFKQKIRHFWYYYKVPFFVFLGVLAFAAYLILHYTVFAPKPYAFVAYALNSAYVKDITSDDETDLDRFLNGFNEYMHFDLTKTQSVINTDMTIDPGSTDNLVLAYDMNLTAAGQAGDADLLIGSGELIDYYIPAGFYQDTIDHYLPEDFYRYLKENDLIYSYVDPTDSKSYEVGVYIGSAKRMKETGLYEGTNIDAPVASVITAHSPRIDVAVEFLKYLFDYPNCAE